MQHGEGTVVIGAGPAGLTAAYELVKHAHPVRVLEKSPTTVGGISQTVAYKGFRFDIGGHRFFSKSQEIEDLWTEILGPKMLVRGRLSRIFYNKKFFDYPIKPFDTFKKLGPVYTTLCVLSYVKARAFPRQKVRSFEDWVVNAFGERLYQTFFKTYTEKVWGMPCTEMSADWAAQRIKGLSMSTLIRNTLFPQKSKDRKAIIKTLIDEFRYPAYGPGQMWERVAELVDQKGGAVLMGQGATTLAWEPGRMLAVVTEQGERHAASHFIATMPMRSLVRALDPPAPPEVLKAALALEYRDFLTVALVVRRKTLFPDNWIYIHDPQVQVGRIQNFKNWSEHMVPDPELSCLGLEYFCFEGDGLWSMSDSELIALGTREVASLGLVDAAEVIDGAVVRVPKAYPVYNDSYKTNVNIVRAFLEEALPNLQLAGRNGMHRYNNQDHAMMTGLLAARNILAGQTRYDPWRVNNDAEYLEEDKDSDTGGRLVPQRIPG
ncbi:NAD(P)/FAD-dependent oxidoreductase [Anthocerotibacter panamensis]|uniref:NAD(P)/FAD-dependent oxidoreductase n=1 Tax=Anthocerotibacter panamensis TaxID=2857077 RepID=UPI001C4022C4